MPDGAADDQAEDSAKRLASLTELMSQGKPPKQGHGTSSQLGMFMGDGFPPVPAKLAGKIAKGEFVEMYKLLPEFWTT